MGLVALRHVGSSQTGDQTCVSCTGRQILYHWATREALCGVRIVEVREEHHNSVSLGQMNDWASPPQTWLAYPSSWALCTHVFGSKSSRGSPRSYTPGQEPSWSDPPHPLPVLSPALSIPCCQASIPLLMPASSCFLQPFFAFSLPMSILLTLRNNLTHSIIWRTPAEGYQSQELCEVDISQPDQQVSCCSSWQRGKIVSSLPWSPSSLTYLIHTDLTSFFSTICFLSPSVYPWLILTIL